MKTNVLGLQFLKLEGVPLSSTHQYNTIRPLLFSPKNPSVRHQKTLSSAYPSVQQTLQFDTKNQWVQQTLQFKTPFSSTHPSVQHQKTVTWTPKTIHFNTLGTNWRFFGVEHRDVLGAEKVWSLCWTDVLNWESLCETGGYSLEEYTVNGMDLSGLLFQIKIIPW